MGGSIFINHDPDSIREESLKSLEAVSKFSFEDTGVDFRIKKTNRLVILNYSNSTSSSNKFQIPTTTSTNTSIKNKGIILQKVILNRKSKKELQWWIQNLKICNGCYLIQFHS